MMYHRQFDNVVTREKNSLTSGKRGENNFMKSFLKEMWQKRVGRILSISNT